MLAPFHGADKPPAPGRHRHEGPGEADERRVVEVTPRGGTLVLFRADRTVHEVCPSHAERLAMTVWMYAGSKEQQRRARIASGAPHK